MANGSKKQKQGRQRRGAEGLAICCFAKRMVACEGRLSVTDETQRSKGEIYRGRLKRNRGDITREGLVSPKIPESSDENPLDRKWFLASIWD